MIIFAKWYSPNCKRETHSKIELLTLELVNIVVLIFLVSSADFTVSGSGSNLKWAKEVTDYYHFPFFYSNLKIHMHQDNRFQRNGMKIAISEK